ncbi:MAG: KTSC domain-containing protein [Pseudomonadota bacterium]
MQSKAIRSAGFDAESNTLEVEFTTGAVYRYYLVPKSVYDWLLRVKSKSAFLERNIKNHFQYRRVDKPASPDTSLAQLLKDSLQSNHVEDNNGTGPSDGSNER